MLVQSRRRVKLGPKAVFFLHEHQFVASDRSVSLLRDTQSRFPLQIRAIAVVELFALADRHQVGILFDRAALAQVTELGPVVPKPCLWRAAEMGQDDERD